MQNTQIDNELIEKLAGAISANMPPVLPLRDQLWNIKTCAKYFGVGETTFLSEYAAAPSFPIAYKSPTKTGQGHRRWRAQDVIDWAFSNPEDKQNRRRSRKNRGTEV